MMLKHLDLCSGIGGFAVGFSMAKLSEPMAFCDTEKFCQKVLAKNFPGIPIYDDVKEIADDPTRFISERPDILTAGYPCQPFSTSGKRGGSQDPRHIFPYLHKLIEQIRPTYCVFENVYGHLSLGLDEVLFAMESLNYQTRTFVVSASSIGARHKRDRVWIICKNLGDSYYHGLSTTKIGRGNEEIARGSEERSEETKQLEGTSGQEDNGSLRNQLSNSNNERIRSCLGGSDNDLQKESGEWRNDRTTSTSHDGRSNIETTKNEDLELSNTTSEGLERRIIQSNMEREQRQIVTERSVERKLSWWEVERQLHGVPNGVSTELDKDRKQRLIALGNAICPQNATFLGLALRGEFE